MRPRALVLVGLLALTAAFVGCISDDAGSNRTATPDDATQDPEQAERDDAPEQDEGDEEAPGADALEAAFTHECEQLDCAFDASSSRASNGSITSYGWALGDGHEATGRLVEHAYEGPGTYTVRLTIADERGNTDSHEAEITLVEEREAADAQVVVGIPDSGINPYHEVFHRPGLTEHPCTYLEDFPCEIPALDLSIGEHDSYEDAYAADEDVWASVEQGQWYWIPETSFVAVYCQEPYSSPTFQSEHCILDDHGHGTGTSSSVVMENPDALIAHKEGSSTIAPFLEADIPIDVYSVSWGNAVPVPGHPDVFCANHESAPLFVTSAGNDPRSTLVDCRKGDPGLVTVGGAYAEDDTEEALAAKQPELVSYYCRPTADIRTMDGMRDSYCGTSFSGPTVAGALSKVILGVREDTGYTGSRTDGTLDPLYGQGEGLTVADLRAAMNRTATYDPDPRYDDERFTGLPLNGLAPWVQWGWGFYDGKVAEETLEHLLGEDVDPKPEPARTYMDAQHTAKTTLYGDV